MLDDFPTLPDVPAFADFPMAWGPPIWGLIGIGLLIGLLSFLNTPAMKGARGERRVNRMLKTLPEEDFHVFDDLIVPARSGTAQIDHVVLSCAGVFVIETKTMTGWIFGDAAQRSWTQVIHRKKTRFQNPLHQNARQVAALRKYLGLEMRQVHGVVAFVGDAVPKTDMPASVVWNIRSLGAFIVKCDTPIFASEALSRLAELLTDDAIQNNRDRHRAHVKHLKERHTRT